MENDAKPKHSDDCQEQKQTSRLDNYQEEQRFLSNAGPEWCNDIDTSTTVAKLVCNADAQKTSNKDMKDEGIPQSDPDTSNEYGNLNVRAKRLSDKLKRFSTEEMDKEIANEPNDRQSKEIKEILRRYSGILGDMSTIESPNDVQNVGVNKSTASECLPGINNNEKDIQIIESQAKESHIPDVIREKNENDVSKFISDPDPENDEDQQMDDKNVQGTSVCIKAKQKNSQSITKTSSIPDSKSEKDSPEEIDLQNTKEKNSALRIENKDEQLICEESNPDTSETPLENVSFTKPESQHMQMKSHEGVITNKINVQNNQPNKDVGKNSISESISQIEPNICINASDDEKSIVKESKVHSLEKSVSEDELENQNSDHEVVRSDLCISPVEIKELNDSPSVERKRKNAYLGLAQNNISCDKSSIDENKGNTIEITEKNVNTEAKIKQNEETQTENRTAILDVKTIESPKQKKSVSFMIDFKDFSPEPEVFTSVELSDPDVAVDKGKEKVSICSTICDCFLGLFQSENQSTSNAKSSDQYRISTHFV